ncbi:MAG TPA: DUF5916 domain-containing protein [Gemmatimonadales bacterium]|jgi:hypothetical protein|nr:DUF5916 domain-containing protein [Gemmatimonadales bacterium]
MIRRPARRGRLRFGLALWAGVTGTVFGNPAAGQEARAVRVERDLPVIDGRLQDPAWTEAPALTQLTQREPVEGATPSESTEVRFVYSDEALYVGFRGFDSAPDRIVGRLVRRDQRIISDYFNLFIDSYYDRRSAFEFSFNPSGARRDVFIYDDGGGRDESWDPVYQWATRVDSLGWVVELRIPFSQLRYPPGDSLVFGLRVRRSLVRRREENSWPFFPRDQVGEVSHFGRLVGLVGLRRPRRLELLPYTAGSASFEPVEDGNPFATGRRSTLRGGTDLKLGLTSGLTLDLTANPDFGQVEADPAVVNLSAFESFFPEKRPFFVEGGNLFRFQLEAPGVARGGDMGGGGGGPGGGGGGGFGGFGEGLVYTRRIGRSPQVSPDAGDGEYVDRVQQTTILGAGKVTGQLPGGWGLGLMQAVTAREEAVRVDSLGSRSAAPVEPLTSYSVLRLQRNARGGRLAFGAIATSVVRHLEGPTRRLLVQPCSDGALVARQCVMGFSVDSGTPAFRALRARAFTGGTDLRWRFGRDRFDVVAGLMGSRVEGSPEAMTETQRNSAHYFQRPDNAYALLDSSRTSLEGFAGYARIAKALGFWTWDLRYQTRSPGFEANDMGFMRRADEHSFRGETNLRWLRPGRVFRRFELETSGQVAYSYGGERGETQVSGRLNTEFANYWGLNLNGERTLASLATNLLRGGAAFAEPGSWRIGGNVRSDFRRSVWGNLGGSYQVEDVTGVTRTSLQGGLRFRPPGPMAVSLEGRVSREADDRQFVATGELPDSVYRLFGHVDRREGSLTFRVDLALTPRMSVELYAQPFVSAGRYSALRLVADPKARAYADRFDPLEADRLTRPGGDTEVSVDVDRDGLGDFTFSEPDFRVVSLRTNAVLRWEFLPGSTLFLVWQQNREDRVSIGTVDFGRGFLDTFTAPGTNVLAVKVAYWVGL